MAGVNEYKDGVVGRLYKGLQGLVKSAQDRARRGLRPARRPRHASRSAASGYEGRNVVLATGSYARTLPGLEHRRPASSPATRRSTLDSVPEPRRRARRRRHRRRVRQRLEVLRRRGDHRRGAAAPGADRGRGLLQGARAGVPQAQDQLQDRRRGSPASTQTDDGVTVVAWRTARRSRPTCCWSPSAAARRRRTSATRRSASRMDRGFVLTDERLRTNVPNVYAVGDIVPGLQLAHRGFAAGHLRRRGDRRPRARRRSSSPASRG